MTHRSWGSPQTFAAPFRDRPDYGDPPEDDFYANAPERQWREDDEADSYEEQSTPA